MEGLKGTRDFFPREMRFRRWLEGRWREVAERYGYEEVDGPVLEPLELYTRKSGDEIVRQLYRLTDAAGREIALRPEMTPTLARMLAGREPALAKPIRWYSIPRLFRYERPQRGRLREFFQLNLDLFGVADESGDAELVCAAADAVRSAGLRDDEFQVLVNDRRLVDALLDEQRIEPPRRPAVLGAVDKLERAPAQAEAALERAGFPPEGRERLLRTFAGELRATVAASAPDGPVARAFAPLQRLQSLAEAGGAGAVVRLNPRVVRGLAYYTGIVFEVFAIAGGLRAICGGGRYDGLLEDLGGSPLPAVGFGMGDAVLEEVLRDLGRVPELARRIDVTVIPLGSADAADALSLSRRLREAGLAVDAALRPAAVGKALGRAAAAGSRFAIVVGEAERASGRFRVRDLTRGEDHACRGDGLVDLLRGRLRTAGETEASAAWGPRVGGPRRGGTEA